MDEVAGEALTVSENLDVWLETIREDNPDGVERGRGRLVPARVSERPILRTPDQSRYSWLFFWPGDAAGMTTTCKPGSQLLNSDGRFNRVITIERGMARFLSADRQVTLNENDRIWVPEGEVYAIEPFGHDVDTEMLLWRIQEGQPFAFMPDPRALNLNLDEQGIGA